MENLHFNKTHTFDEDFFPPFQELYSNSMVNVLMITIYLLGIVSCIGLRLVSWFERSGQAGPYRTLVNRLMSITLDQV